MSTRQTRKRLQWIGLGLCCLTAATTSCQDSAPSVYTARAYEPDAKCLDDYTSVGLVDVGSLSAACDPACLEIAGTLYVSTVCPPLPDEATPVSPSDAPCVDALALFKAGTTCGN
jgi:hypothetical protein